VGGGRAWRLGRVQAAVRALQALAQVAVTAQVLSATGAGRALAQLKKHADPQVAAAASETVAAWKERVLAAKKA